MTRGSVVPVKRVRSGKKRYLIVMNAISSVAARDGHESSFRNVHILFILFFISCILDIACCTL